MRQKMKIRNIKWILSAMVFVGLIAVANIEGMMKAGVGMILLAALGIMLPDLQMYIKKTNRILDICALMICVLAGAQFYSMWMPSSMVAGIAGRIHMSKESFLAIAACIGLLLALYAVRIALYTGLNLAGRIAKQQSETVSFYDAGCRIPKKSYVFLLVTAALIITICSKSSPLYPLNDWVDANCFFTVGKSMLHGKVLYRDIFEHKGFYLYVLHALGYLISNTTFFGVYLLEIAAAFAFLVYTYRIALLFCSDADVIYLIPVLAAFVYGTQAFSHGDSAEEFCLPLLVYALWVGLKTLRNNEMPTNKEFFWIGVTSGCVLWIKYTMLGFYLGWFIVPAYLMIRGRAWKKLISSVAAIALGAGVATLPVVVYFAANGALHDLWQVYFYDNMFIYSSAEGVKHSTLKNIVQGSYYALLNNGEITLAIILGIAWFGMIKKGKISAQLLCSMLCTAIFVFCGDGRPKYYAFVFAAFMPTALPMLGWLLTRVPESIRRCCRRACPICGVVLALLLNNNAYMLRYTEDDLPQFAFKQYVDQVENPTLLNYGFLDGGFYTVYDIVPHCKYFCRLNVQLEEMIETQDDYVKQGLSDFVVTRGKEIESELYECVAQGEFYFEKDHIYRLYALKSLGIVSDMTCTRYD